MVFPIVVEERMSQCIFLGLLYIDDDKKVAEVLFEILIISMKK